MQLQHMFRESDNETVTNLEHQIITEAVLIEHFPNQEFRHVSKLTAATFLAGT